jgi:aldehyde dehydrogenase (NAD+)
MNIATKGSMHNPTLLCLQARGRMLYKLADLMEEHLTQLALLESLDSGKPLEQSYTKEMPLCVDNFRYFAG